MKILTYWSGFSRDTEQIYISMYIYVAMDEITHLLFRVSQRYRTKFTYLYMCVCVCVCVYSLHNCYKSKRASVE